MNIFSVGMIAFAAGALVAGGTVYRLNNQAWQAIIDRQKIEATAMLQAETEKVLVKERENAELQRQAEVAHNEATEKITAMATRYRALVRERGGLRDPGRGNGGHAAVSADNRTGISGTGATKPGISEQATEFLLGEAERADRAAQYARDCRTWALSVVKLER